MAVAALVAVSLLFVSCPREIGLGAAVDTQKPVVSILTPEVDAVLKDTISLSGKATDETSLESVSVKFQSTEYDYSKTYAAELNLSAGTWSLTVNTEDATNGLLDSKYEVTVTAKDRSGKTSIAARSFQIDNSAPAILVTKPSTYGGNNEKETVTYYKMVEIRGEAYDASAIQEVRVGLYKGNGTLIKEKVADGTDTWSALFYESDLGNLSYDSGSSISEPVYLYVKAIDKANNVSTYYYHKSDMYSLLKTKKTSQTDELYFPTTTQIGYLDSSRAALTVTGVKADNTPISVDVSKEELSATKHEAFSSAAAANYPRFLFTTAATASIEWNNFDIASPAIGIGSDILASIQPASDGSSVNLDSLSIKLVKPEGNFDGTPFTPLPLEFETLRMGEAVNLTIHTPDEWHLAPGLYDLVLYGTTNGGSVIGYDYDDDNPPSDPDLIENDGYVRNLSLESTDIIITRYKPGLVTAGTVSPDPEPETATANVWYVNNDYYVIADITGLSITTDVTLSINDDDDIAVPKLNGNLSGVWQGTSYENNGQILHLKYKASYADMPDVATIILTAGTVSKQLNIEKDETAPAVNITSPVDGKAYSDSGSQVIVLKGTATDDGSGVKAVYYTLDESNPTRSSETATKTGSNWTIVHTFATEGTYTLKVIAEDNLGKLSSTQTVKFYKDLYDPQLSVKAYVTDTVSSASPEEVPDGNNTNRNFTLIGKAWDSDLIDEITVTGQGKTWSNKTGTGKIQAITVDTAAGKKPSFSEVTADNWRLDFKIGTGNSSQQTYYEDGTTTFTITITDIAGKAKSYTRTITVDSGKPSFPSGSTGFEAGVVEKDINKKKTLSVKVADNPVVSGGYSSGLAGVYYKMTADSVTSAPAFTDATESSWKSMASDTDGWTADVDFSSVTTDSNQKVWIAAKDRAGNRAVYSSPYTATVDLKKPVLSVSSGNNFTTQAENLELIVKVTDSNAPGADKITISAKMPNADATGTAGNDPVNLSSSAYTVTAYSDHSTDTPAYKEYKVIIPFKTQGKDLGSSSKFNRDGHYTIVINAKDMNNRSAEEITFDVLQDTTAPVVVLDSYEHNSSIKTSTLSVHGKATDSRMSKVEAWLEKGGVDQNGEGGEHGTVNTHTILYDKTAGIEERNSAGEFTFTTYNLGEGEYVAYVRATDEANESTEAHTAKVMIDLTPPDTSWMQATEKLWNADGTVVSGLDLTDDTIYLANEQFAIKGTITEAHINSVKLYVTKDRMPVLVTTATATADTPKNIYSWHQQEIANVLQYDSNNDPVKVVNAPDAGCTWDSEHNTWGYTQNMTGDGSFYYTLVIGDDAGNQTTEMITVKVDNTAPTLRISTPGNNTTSSEQAMTVSGTVTDSGSGPKKVYYTIDGTSPVTDKQAAATSTTASSTASINGNTWEFDHTFDEGNFTLKVLAEDNMGNTSVEKTAVFSVDINNPDIIETIVGNDSTTTKTGFTLGGKACDTNDIDEITVSTTVGGVTKTWSSKTGDFKIDLKTQAQVDRKKIDASDVSANNWSIAFVTGTYSGTTAPGNWIADGTNAFTIVVTDKAGKKRSINRTVTVDTTDPAISVGSGDGFPVTTVNGTAIPLIEQDKSPYATLRVQVEDPVQTMPNDPAHTVVTGASASGLEGVWYKIARLQDDSGNDIPAPDNVNATWTDIAAGNDGWKSMAQGTTGWTASVDFSSSDYADKEVRAYIAAKDRAGNRVLYTADDTVLTPFVDKQKPVLEVISGDDFTSQSSNLELHVSMIDTNPAIDDLSITVYKPKADRSAVNLATDSAATLAAQKVTLTCGVDTSGNTYDIKLAEITAEGDAAHKVYKVIIPFKTLGSDLANDGDDNTVSRFATDGHYTVVINGKDEKDRAASQITFDVLQDVTPPVVTLSSYASAAQIANGVFIKNNSLTITGNATDDTLDEVKAWLVKDGNEQAREDITTSLKANGDFTWTKYDLSEGTYVAHVQAKDKANLKNDVITGGATTAAITVDLTAPKSSIEQNTAGTLHTEAGNSISNTTLLASSSEETDAGTYLAKGEFTLKGVITEKYLSSATLTVKKGSTTVLNELNLRTGNSDSVWEAGSSANTNTWKYTQRASGADADGTYVYTLTLVDKAGNQTKKTITVKLDTTAPTVNITGPANNESFLETPITIKGTAIDNGAGASKVYYTFGAASGTVADPTTASSSIDVGGSSWSASILTGSNEAEGTFLLKVIAADKLGNKSSNNVQSVHFSYDKNYPDLTETAAGTTGLTTTGDFTLKGQAWDTNQIDEITISAVINGETKVWSSKEDAAAVPATSTTPASPAKKKSIVLKADSVVNSKVGSAEEVVDSNGNPADNWSIDFKTGTANATKPTYIPDGTTAFTITIKDIAGKSKSYTRTVTVDTVAPSFPSGSTGFANAVVENDRNSHNTLKVKVADNPPEGSDYASGISGVFYKLTEADVTTAPAFTSDSGWTAMSLDNGEYTADINFASVTTDKSQKAWIAAKDAAGHRVVNPTTYTTFIDQHKPVLSVEAGGTFTSKTEDLELTVRVTDTNPVAPTVSIYKPKADGKAVGNVSDLSSYTKVNLNNTSNASETTKIYVGLKTSNASYKDYKVVIPFNSNTDIFDTDGHYTIIINGKDEKNREAAQIAHEVLQDHVKPTVTLSTYASADQITNGVYIKNSSLTIEGTAHDENLVKVEAWLVKDGVAQTAENITNTRKADHSFKWSQYELEEGTYVAHVKALDEANLTEEKTTASITVDLTPPETTLLRPDGTTLYTEAGISSPVSGTTLTNGAVYLAKGNFSLSGKITEANLKSAKLTVKKDGTTLLNGIDMKQAVSGRNTWTNSTGVWTYIQSASTDDADGDGVADGDGTYAYTIDLEDLAGNKTTRTLTVKVDRTAPSLLVTTPGDNQSSIVPGITFRGTAEDEGAGLASVHYSYYNIADDLTADPVAEGDAEITGNTWKKSVTIGAEGTFKLVVTAKDKLGNTTETESPITFSFDCNDPELVESKIGNDSTITNGGAAKTFTLGGKAWDTNEIDEITVTTTVNGETKVWSSKEDADAVAATATSAAIPAKKKSITLLDDSVVNSKVANAAAVTGDNWSIVFKVGNTNATQPTFIADGTNSFTIVITDIAGKSRSYNRTVTVDSTLPEIRVETGDGFANSLVEKDISAFVELKVHADDPLQKKTNGDAITGVSATGLTGVYYQITAGDEDTAPTFTDATESAWTSMSQGTGAWTANVNFSSVTTDCEKKVWIAAKDRAGNRFVFEDDESALKTYIDQHKPVLSVTGNDFTSGNQGDNPQNLTLTVRVTDTNPTKENLSAVVYMPADDGTALNLSTASAETLAAKKVAISSYTFSGPVDATVTGYKDYTVAIPFNSNYQKFTPDGKYTVVINGKDAKNRAADQITHIVLKDSQAPSVELSSYQTATSLKVGTLSVTGTVTDPNLESVLIWLNDDEAHAENITNARNSSGTFTWTKYELEQGDYVVHVKATDKAGLTTAAQTATINIDMTAPRTSIMQNAANSLYTEEGVSVAGTTLLAANAADTNAGTYLAKAGFTLKGAIAEEHLASATLFINGDTTGINLKTNVAGSHTWTDTTANPQTWTYIQPVNASTHVNDGTYVYTIKLVDNAGNQTTETVTVKVDTTKPVISITKPGSDESFLEAPVPLSGTVSDAVAGIRKVYYTIDGSDPTAGNPTATPPVAASPEATVNGSSWSAQVLTGDNVAEGKFTLKVIAVDKLGFTSEVTEVDFSYDTHDPELVENGLGSDGLTKNAGFTLKGRAWDSNEIDEITISAVVNNQTKTWSNKAGTGKKRIASLITAAGITAGKKPTFEEVTADNWSIDFVVGSANSGSDTYLTDGTISFTITIKDIAGKSRSYNRTVTIDSKAPTISQVEGDGFASALVKQDESPFSMLKVTVSDEIATGGTSATGLEGVWYKIAADEPENNDTTWTKIAAETDGWVAMSRGTSKWTANVDFSDTDVYSANGTQKAWIAAKDRAGNRTISEEWAETYIDIKKPVLTVQSGDDFTDATEDLELVIREADTNPTLPQITVVKPSGTEMSTADAAVMITEMTVPTGSAYKDYKVTIRFNPNGAYWSGKTYTYSEDGKYKLFINAHDDKLRDAEEISWTILKDQTPPEVELTSYTTATFTSNQTLTVTGTVKDDNLSSVIAWLDDESNAEDITNLLGAPVSDEASPDFKKRSFTWKQYELSEGPHVVYIKATDQANLESNAADGTSAVITIDTTAPDSTFAYECEDDGELYTNMGTALLQPVLAGGGTYLAKTAFTLKGVITETNFQEATLSIKKDNVALDPVSISAAGNWSYAQDAEDGTYEYTLSVKDKANNQFKQTVTVKVDTTAPILTIETPGDGQTTNAESLSITGSVTDTGAGGVTVLYSYDGSAPSIPATVTGSTWSDTIDFNNVEGAFVFKIKAMDALGNTTAVEERNFSYDLNLPGIEENVTGDAGLTTNAGFTLGGKAWDTNQIDEITITGQNKTWSNKSGDGKIQAVTIKPDKTAAGTPEAEYINSKVNSVGDVGNNNWSIDFVVGSANAAEDTYVADGTTAFTITIKDVAGKKIDFTRTISVDTVSPVITVNDYNAETQTPADGFTNGLVEKDVSPYNKLTVHASDSGATATGLEGVWYKIATTKPAFTSAADEATWTAMAQGSGGAWTANVDFSSVTANGDQKAWIAAKDRAGNRVVYAGKTATDDGSITTFVDIMKPVLSVNAGAATFTDASADIDIKVRVTDTNPMAPTIIVKDNDNAAISEPGVSIIEDTAITGSAGYKEWTVTIPFKTKGTDYDTDGDAGTVSKYPADGTYTILINGKDTKDRLADQITHSILRDTTAPAVSVALTQSATTPGYTPQGTVTATGTATDANLTAVTATLVKNGTDQTPEDITATRNVDGEFTWKQYDQADGTYKVKITATDLAGHSTTVTSDQVIVDKTAPSVAYTYEGPTSADKLFTNTGTALETSALSAGGSYMAKTAFTLKGVITEANLRSATLTVKKDGAAVVSNKDLMTAVTGVNTWTAATKTWTYAQGATDADGTYVYTIKTVDQAGNQTEESITVLLDTAAPTVVITKPASSEKIETATYKFAGTVSDLGAGVDSVTYVLKNAGVPKATGNATVTGGSWAINGTNDAGVTLGDEGSLSIEVTATDILGQTVTETTTFFYDEAAPDLDETSIGVSTLITNAAFTLTGTASDSNALAGVNDQGVAVGAINISKGTGSSKVDYGNVDVAAPVAPATAGVWTKTFTPGTGAGKLADGTYVFSIKATDVSGRETVIQRTVVVDTVAPTISKISGKSTFITDEPTNNWFKKGTVAIGASVSDDRDGGVAAVEYAVISNPNLNSNEVLPATAWEATSIEWKSMSKSGSNYIANAEVEDGMNYIAIRATDAAGNATYTTQETAQVDTIEPSLVGAYEDQNCTIPIMSKFTNAADAMIIYIKTEDPDAVDETKEGSGANSIVAKIGNKSFTSDTISATSVVKNVFKLSLSEEQIQAGRGSEDAQKTVYIKIKDKAGNETSATSLFNLQYDTEGPEIEFVMPATDSTASETTVNKTISITGKASDLQGLYSVSMWYLYNDSNEDHKAQIGTTKTGKDAANWSFTFDTTTLLDHKLGDDEDSDLTLIAVATDDAGNQSTRSITIKVDQMEDIPEITITQPESLTGMTSANPVWLIINKQIQGTIIDDDGISSLKMSTDGGTSWTNVPVINGTFKATLPSDDTYTIMFKAADVNEGEFVSDAKTTNNQGEEVPDPLKSIKLKDSDGVVSADGRLYITIDTENPQTQTVKYALDGTSTTASDWTPSLLTETTFGGTAETAFTIKQYAYDENGIQKVEVVIDGGTPVAATKQSTDQYTDPITDEVYDAYTYTVDCSTLETNLGHTLKVVVTDNAGKTTETTTTFKVDNTAPTVTLGSHAEGENVKGTFFVSGTTQDAPLYGPADTLLYKVTTSSTTPSGAGAWDTLPTTNENPAAHEVEGNLASWRIYFDDDLNVQDGYTHDRALKKILVQLRNDLEIATAGEHVGAVVWKTAGTGHAAGDLYTPITYMYIHLKATDAYGNETDFVRTLALDPQGDIPTVTVAYPLVTGYGWKNGSDKVFTTDKIPEVGDYVYANLADMETPMTGTITAVNREAKTITYNGTTYTNYGGETVQGGYIRVQGTADGQNAIKKIFMQVDPAYNRATGFSWDPTGNALMPNGEKLSTKYTITNFFTGSTMKGIEVGDSVSWSVLLNRNSEFNGIAAPGEETAPKSYIGIRLYAVDEKNNVSQLNVADDIVITIDSDSPLVGSSEELYLYQYSNNAAGSGTVTASMKYEDDMWLKGEWWIQGSVEDSNGIQSITVQEQNGTSWNDITHTQTAKNWMKKDTQGNDTTEVNSMGFVIKFKIGSSDEDEFGKLIYQINALDKDSNAKSVTKQISVNFDNAAPVLAGPTHEDYNISHEVVQNNGFYTLGSSITETGSSSASQSGFERVALYFVRPGTAKGKGTLYDTYFLKTTQANPTKNELKINVNTTTGAKNTGSDVSYSDGLYWKTQEITRNPNNLSDFTLTTADANIHKGGMVRIGGTMYIISAVNGTRVTIKGSPAIANTATNKENADFAMALIIDHALTEGNGTAANLVDGYYTDVVNDDGDRIVEKVATQGYTTFWEANICSRNIPDGAIEIHYVAYDKAGNYASGIVACEAGSSYKGLETVADITYDYDANNLTRVANNAPRLAGVMFGTDDDGDGTVQDDEMHSEYFAMNVSTAGVKESYTNSSLRESYLMGIKDSVSVLKIKGATKIVPEIVGGNGTLGYSWTVTNKDATTPYYRKNYKELTGVSGSDYSATGAASEIKDVAINLSVLDLLSPDDIESETLLDGENQLFAFTIWDSTAGMTAGSNSQKATLELVADLDLQDTTPPKTYIKPFFWKSTAENSIYKISANGKSTLQGHIEISSDLPDTFTENGTGVNDRDDKVSGSIVIEGTAQDNVLLKDIYMELYTGDHGVAFTFPGATKVGGNGTLKNFYNVAHYQNGTWTSTGSDYNNNGWAFSIVTGSEQFTQEEGHTVTWQLILNTEKITNVAASDVKLVVRARDQGSPTPVLTNNVMTGVSYTQNTSAGENTNKTSGDTVETQTNWNRFDVVPYITGVNTRLSTLKKNNPTIYNRTALGHYPVSAGETVIFAGFNLAGAKYGNTTLAALENTELATMNAYYKNLGTSWRKMTVGTNQASGEIQLTNNGIGTLNNLNNDDSMGTAIDENENPVVLSTANYDAYAYNRQPNGDNNLYLTDNVYFDVWSINTQAAQARDGGVIEEPVMAINPSTGAIGLAFASGSDSFCMPGTINNNTYSYAWWSTNYANFSNIALTYDSGGNAWSIAIGLDTNSGDGGYGGRMALMGSLWGRGESYNGTKDNFHFSNKMRLESIGVPAGAQVSGTARSDYLLDTKRFKSTTLAVTKHGTRRGFYLAYYDRLTGQIRFRSGSTTATTKNGISNNDPRNFGQFYDNYGISNGETNYNNAGYLGAGNDGNQDWAQHRCFEPRRSEYSLIAGAETNVNSADSTTGFVAGPYVALDVIPGTGDGNTGINNDVVIVTFYDGSDLWYVTRQGGVGSDNNVLKTSENGNWSKPIQVFEGIGQNCTIKAGPDGSVHIACYDQTEGCLKYAYMSSAGGSSFKTATIDGYGIAGSNISIDVVTETITTDTDEDGDGENDTVTVYTPYLSYFAPSIQKVKMAYLKDYSALSSSTEGALEGCDDNDSFTGVWECAIIPTASAVNDDNTSIGFYKDANGAAQIISTAGTASAGKQNGVCKGNGTANPAIAYATTVNATGYIEVVQKQ